MGDQYDLIILDPPAFAKHKDALRNALRGYTKLNAKAFEKIKPGGILIYDGYGIIEPPTRKDIQIYRIDAMDAANEKGMAKTFNMIVLGGLLKLRPVVSIESVIKALRKTLPERHHHLIPMNEEAIRIGMEIIKPQ